MFLQLIASLVKGILELRKIKMLIVLPVSQSFEKIVPRQSETSLSNEVSKQILGKKCAKVIKSNIQ